MSFFDDDPFEEIIREFFSHKTNASDKPEQSFERKIIDGEEEERIIDFIEGPKKFYIIFEFPGYEKKDILVFIKNRQLEIKLNKKREEKEKIQSYLSQKLSQSIVIKKILPKFINSKKFKSTMKNGILEISFDKKNKKIKG